MEELLKRARNGDAEAFIQLIEQNKQSLYKVARGYFSESMDIEDAISETVLNAWEHLGQIRKPAHLKSWLIRVLINNCNDVKRRQARVIALEQLPETPVSDPDPGDLGFESLLRCLPETYRPVMILYYGEGFSVQEIARLLKLPVGTVTSRLKRGRERLAGLLQEKECM